MQATLVFTTADLVSIGNDQYVVRFPQGSSEMISVQPDGSLQTKPIQPSNPPTDFEKCRIAGSWIVFDNIYGKRFAFPLVP